MRLNNEQSIKTKTDQNRTRTTTVALDYWLIHVDIWRALVCLAWTYDSLLFHTTINQTFHYQEWFIMRTLQQIRRHNKTLCTCLWVKAQHFIRIKTLLAACFHPTSDIIGYVKTLLFPLIGEKRNYICSHRVLREREIFSKQFSYTVLLLSQHFLYHYVWLQYLRVRHCKMKAQKFSPKTLIIININPKRAAIVKEEAFAEVKKIPIACL